MGGCDCCIAKKVEDQLDQSEYGMCASWRRRWTKGCCLKLRNEPEPKHKPHCCASFIVKYPCACIWLSLVLSIAMTVVGWAVVFMAVPDNALAGPLRLEGLDYPNKNSICKASDALVKAMDDSEEALKRLRQSGADGSGDSGSGEGGGRRRRLSEFRGGDADMAGTQYQQEHELANLGVVVEARDEGGNALDDSGLEELCSMHNELRPSSFPDYCFKKYFGDFNGARSAGCVTELTPLVLFYGDENYDINDVELSTFDIAAFDQIVIFSRNNNDQALAALVNSGAATWDEVTLVKGLVAQLYNYVWNATADGLGTWLNGTVVTDLSFTCQPEYKKDTEHVIQVMAQIRSKVSLRPMFGGTINTYFDAGFSATNPKTRYSRTFYKYGGPLAGYTNVIDGDDIDAQEKDFADWWKDEEMRKVYHSGGPVKWNDLRPTGLVDVLLLQEMLDLLIQDGVLAIFPVVVVFLVVWFQTRSAFIAMATIVEMLLSFLGALFITAGVLQIKWMAFEQFLAMYIVLAIGADDVFVFMDAYKQSFYAGREVNKDLVTRMSWVYRRAGMAMLITSCTTCAAFIATAASSPIPTLQNFGIFAAAVIFFDYTLVMTFLCACVVFYHNTMEMKPNLFFACCTCAKKGSNLDWWLCYASAYGGCDKVCDCPLAETSTEIAAKGGVGEMEHTFFMRVFEDYFPFNLFVKPKIPRALCLVAFLAVLGPCIWGATGLEPQKSSEQFLPESHPFQRYITLQEEFLTSNNDEVVEIQVVWGMQSDQLDTSGVNLLFDPDNKGSVKYDDGFAFSAATQVGLVEACDHMEAERDPPLVQRTIDDQTGNATAEIYCFIRGFRDYQLNRSEPFPVQGVQEAELALQHYMQFGGSSAEEYEGDVGFLDDGSGGYTLKWCKMRVSSQLRIRQYLSASELRDRYDLWEDAVGEINAAAPADMGDAFQVAGTEVRAGRNKWISMVLQETYVRMACVGVGVGLGVAFFVLLISTCNLLMTSLCILTIAAALVCVVASVVWRGWELGSAESLSMMILTGFAVDYVVHLSHAYMDSRSSSRLERTHDALRDLGISVFWGMLTSVVSAIVLANLQLQFFSKFGTFFLLTIIWAYVWAVLFLMPLLAFIGPEAPPRESGSHSRQTAPRLSKGQSASEV